jgi:protein involved in polysaccharide export with SLBB domain
MPDLTKEMLSFDLNSIMAGSSPDIALMREDSVFVISNANLKDELSVSIGGLVRFPGTFTYRKGMKLADVIAMSGGFSSAAANHRIEISRLVKDRKDSVANKLLDIFTLDVDSSLQTGHDAFMLQPLDYIYVPRLVNYKALGNVTIGGEVLFPGNYALQRRDENALEFIQRAGGITPSGSLADAQVFRNKVRVDVNLVSRKTTDNDLLLMSGDSIFIPRKVTLVEVSGAVNNPQLLAYSGSGFKQYIRGSGGVKQNGRLKNAYVQYPDGTNRPVGRFLFFRTYPKVEPGSKIVVPESSGVKVKLGLGEVTALTSALTVIVTLISVLSR